MKVEQLSVSVSIPASYAVKAYGAVKSYGAIKREEWRSDGSWYGIIEMPGGSYASFLNKLGEITKGNGEAKVVN